MINWILGLFNSIRGDLNNVIKWILGLISAVYSFIDQLFNSLERELVSVWNELYGFFLSAWRFIVQIYDILSSAIVKVWNDIVHWVVGLWNDLTKFVSYVWSQLVHWVDYILSWVTRLWNDLMTWVIKNIWDPLYNNLLQAWKWILERGELVYYYITHPDRLVALLGHWLWISWVDLLKRYGKTIGRWLAHVMMSMVSDFVTILEDFISGIL